MQSIAIISSSKDPAGINIRERLIELHGFEEIDEKFEGNKVYQYITDEKTIKLYLTNSDLIETDDIDKRIDADFLVFASKHRSRENTRSFTVHTIGNWGKADMGGRDKNICPSSAVLLKNMFIALNENAKDTGYEIAMEATHHGPYVETPTAFVEIGSTEAEWSDKNNGEMIAKAIMDAMMNANKDYKIAIGLGGTHYCANFNKIILNTGIALSFVCPKYALQFLDEDLVSQALRKSKEKVEFFLLDWKGMGTEKQRIVELLKKLNIEMIRTEKIEKG